MPPHAPIQQPLHIAIEPDRERIIVRLSGEIDMATLPALELTVAELREAGFDTFTIDLRGLTFIDSSGLNFLLRLSAEDLRLTVVPGPRPVQRAFDLAGVTDAVPFARPRRSRPSRLALRQLRRTPPAAA